MNADSKEAAFQQDIINQMIEGGRVLDDQLQETIYQFEHADGVVGRINRDEGQGSKSEKLASSIQPQLLRFHSHAET